jgi:amino acid permease
MTENIPALSVTEEEEQRAKLRKQRWILAGIIVGAIILVAAVGVAVYFLVQSPSTASNLRDIFIIFMALESLIIGAALVVLIVQVASLINLLQNEVKPILQSTSETVNTLRGTTEFLSENLVEPVIKLNSYLAGLRKFFNLFGLNRK